MMERYEDHTLCGPASGFQNDLESDKGAGKRTENRNTADLFPYGQLCGQ